MKPGSTEGMVRVYVEDGTRVTLRPVRVPSTSEVMDDYYRARGLVRGGRDDQHEGGFAIRASQSTRTIRRGRS